MTQSQTQQSDARLTSTVASGFGWGRAAGNRHEPSPPDPRKGDGDTPSGKREGKLFDQLRWGTGQEPVIEALNR
jgi:hypothetical protein